MSDESDKLDPKVVPLPLPRERVTELVREAAKTERRSVNLNYDAGQQFRRLLNYRQIDSCLREGYVLDEHARLDEHGNWRFRIARVCAGVHVILDVALQATPEPHVFVVAITGDVIAI